MERIHQIWSWGLHKKHIFFLVGVFFWVGVAQTPGQTRVATEEEVKSAFLFNFFKYADWPQSHTPPPGGEYIIGIWGESSVFHTLQQTLEKARPVNDRVVRVKKITQLDQLKACQVVFIPAEEKVETIREIISQTRGRPLLTVSDFPSFARFGGMFEFVKESERIRLHVNVSVVEESGLRISPNLLRLCTLEKEGRN